MQNKHQSTRQILSALAIAAVMLGAAPAVSAQTAAKVSYNPTEESITVQVTTDKLNKSAALTVESEGRYYVIAEFERTSKTNFSYTCKLPTTMSSGTYTAVVTIGGEKAEADFSHINRQMAAEALRLVNDATAETFDAVINANGGELALNVDEFNEYKTLLTQLFFLYRPTGDLTIEEFSSLYNRCLALSKLKGQTSAAQLETDILAQADIIAFDAVKYQALTDAEKKEILGRFQKGAYHEKDIQDEYAQWFALADINGERDSSVSAYRKAILETYAGILQLATDDYKESADADEVIRLVMDASYDSVEDLQTAFYAAVKRVGKKTSSSGSGSSSSSGGGGRGSSPGSSSGGNLVRWGGESKDTETVSSGFTDVAADHWCAQAAKSLSDRGVISGVGDGRFLPDQSITRAEFAKMLLIALYGNTTAAGANDFTDVSEQDWFYAVVTAAKKNRLITGDADGRFRPNETISRQDMAVMLARGLAAIGAQGDVKELSFRDADTIADYAKEAVAGLCGRGILSGMADGSFQPKGALSRAQAAKALYETLRVCGRL